MTKRTKQAIIVITYTIVLVGLLVNLEMFVPFAENLCSLLLPVFTGLIIAFILNVPMSAIERSLKKATGKKLRGVSLLLTLAAILLVLALVSKLVFPELVNSVKSVSATLTTEMPEIIDWLNSHNLESVTELLEGLNLDEISTKLLSGAGTLMDSVVSVVSSTVSMLGNALVGCIIAVYVLLSKEKLSRQAKKLLYAIFKGDTADKICDVCSLVNSTYSKFLGGQCVEACILAVLMFAVYSIIGLPYGGLVGVLAGLCSFIPYVGAFIACSVGVILILMIDPFKALISIVVYLVTQFVENQFIYPRVVGNSVGLSPLWTLLAVMAGGRLFGLMGMIFFIPLTSVLYTLISDFINKKLAEKNMNVR